MAEPTSLLLGLEGLDVTAVTRGTDRSRVVDVVTADRRAAHCRLFRIQSACSRSASWPEWMSDRKM